MNACVNMSWLNMIRLSACFCFPNSFFQFSFISANPCDIWIVNVRVYKGHCTKYEVFH